MIGIQKIPSGDTLYCFMSTFMLKQAVDVVQGLSNKILFRFLKNAAACQINRCFLDYLKTMVAIK